MRAPSLMPTVTESKTTCVGYSRWRASAPSRCATGTRLQSGIKRSSAGLAICHAGLAVQGCSKWGVRQESSGGS